MNRIIRIGTRGSELAVWQAMQVKKLLEENNCTTEIIPIKSEGDLDLKTPIYAMGVQGVFTKNLDAALLNNQIDIAVHSMKDVPVQLAQELCQAAVLKRGTAKDLLVYNNDLSFLENNNTAIIATSSIRRRAQWLHKYPHHQMENLRGNVNTRLRKLSSSNWNGAIFAAAGLERIGLRSENSIELNWMLPSPAQGAIMIVCKENDDEMQAACKPLNDNDTAICTRIERDFLTALLGGCSTPISAYAFIKNGHLFFEGNIFSPDGKENINIKKEAPLNNAMNIGTAAGNELLQLGGKEILKKIKAAEKKY